MLITGGFPHGVLRAGWTLVAVLGTAMIQQADTYYVNVALNKSAYQVSTYHHFETTFPADLAVDGDTNPDTFALSCANADLEDQPWWMVDLGEEYLITAVEITNRDNGRISAALSSGAAYKNDLPKTPNKPAHPVTLY